MHIDRASTKSHDMLTMQPRIDASSDYIAGYIRVTGLNVNLFRSDERGSKGSHPGPFFLFFYKAYKRGGGSFPFIKIYVVDFIYSGGLWQHEIGIEKVF